MDGSVYLDLDRVDCREWAWLVVCLHVPTDTHRHELPPQTNTYGHTNQSLVNTKQFLVYYIVYMCTSTRL